MAAAIEVSVPGQGLHDITDAVRSHVRGYALGRHTLILTVSDSGETSAIVVGARS